MPTQQMDDFSGAASAIGLALQVAKIACKIHHDIKAYSPDGKGLKRLSSILTRITQVATQTRRVLEQLNTPNDLGFLEGDILFDIHSALTGLERNLALAASEFAAVRALSAVKRAALVLQRKLTSEHLQELESLLGDDLDILNNYISLHTWALVSRSIPPSITQADVTIESDQTILVDTQSEISSTEEEDGDHTHCSQSLETALARTRRVTQEGFSFYSRILGHIQHSTTSRISLEHDQTSTLSTTSTIGVRLPLTSRGIEIQYCLAQYAPLMFSLHTVHHIDEELARNLRCIMLDGTLQDMQNLMASGQIHLYSVEFEHQRGSLLHMAAAHFRLDICRWLLTQDSAGRLLAQSTEASFSMGGPGNVWYDVVDMLLNHGKDDIDIQLLVFLAEISDNPRHILHCMDIVKTMAPDLELEHKQQIMVHSLLAFKINRTPKRQFGAWRDLFRHLIRENCDLPFPSIDQHFPALHFLNDHDCPCQSSTTVNEFLDVLASTGMDVAAYLEEEAPRSFESLSQLYARYYPERKVFLRQYRSWVVPCWEWRCPRDSLAYDVLSEFRHHPSWDQDKFWTPWLENGSVAPEDWRMWINILHNFEGQHLYWPLVYRPIYDSKVEVPNSQLKDQIWKAKQIFNKRYDRKYARKQAARGRPLYIPGPWTD